MNHGGMLQKELLELPYLVHTNRELGLMLRGVEAVRLLPGRSSAESQKWSFATGACSTGTSRGER